MAKLEFAARIFDDIDRFIAHLLQSEAIEIDARMMAIYQAIEVLAANPLIGRPAMGEWRELVIGSDSRGYVALYSYELLDDTVYVWAIRSQREVGYDDGVI